MPLTSGLHQLSIDPAAHNSALPVMVLFPDIFPMVMEQLADAWRPAYHELGWMSSSHVCQRWRSSIISMASLWAREPGVVLSYSMSPNVVHSIVQRAQAVPLHLRIPPNQALDGYVELLPRAKALALTLKPDDMHNFMPPIAPAALPNLETLSISWGDADNFPATTMSNELPKHLNIHRLRLVGFWMATHAPHLIEFRLQHAPSAVHIQDLLEALRSFPCLEILFIERAILDFSGFVRRGRLTLPQLGTLRLQSPHDSSEPYCRLVSLLDLPKLHTLDVHDQCSALPKPTSVIRDMLESVARNSVWVDTRHDHHIDLEATRNTEERTDLTIEIRPIIATGSKPMTDDAAVYVDPFIAFESLYQHSLRPTIKLQMDAVLEEGQSVSDIAVSIIESVAMQSSTQKEENGLQLCSAHISVRPSSEYGRLALPWSRILPHLTDVHTLHVAFPIFDDDSHPIIDDGLLQALVAGDNTCHVPRLQTIVVMNDWEGSHGTPSPHSDARVLALLEDVLRTRAACGHPIACVRMYNEKVESESSKGLLRAAASIIGREMATPSSESVV